MTSSSSSPHTSYPPGLPTAVPTSAGTTLSSQHSGQKMLTSSMPLSPHTNAVNWTFQGDLKLVPSLHILSLYPGLSQLHLRPGIFQRPSHRSPSFCPAPCSLFSTPQPEFTFENMSVCISSLLNSDFLSHLEEKPSSLTGLPILLPWCPLTSPTTICSLAPNPPAQ